MSTTLSRWSLPSYVFVRELVLSDDYEVVIRGRDRVLAFTVSRMTLMQRHGEATLREIIDDAVRRLQREEAALDAVTAKLMS
jgi:hypothetical protein